MRKMTLRYLAFLFLSDFKRYEVRTLRSKFSLFFHNGWRCAIYLRLQQYFYSWRFLVIPYVIALVIQRRMLHLFGIEICVGSEFGPGLKFPHPVGIVIGPRVVIGGNCTILQGVTIGESNATGNGDGCYPIIRDNVLIGANSLVLGNVLVGEGARIGAHSLILASVNSNAVVTGIHK